MGFKDKYDKIIVLASAFMLLMGCCMHTNSSKFAYYPPNTIYKDSQYSLIINMRGAGCKAYTDYTQKDIYMKLEKKDGSKLLEKTYVVKAGNLNCYWQWEKEDKVTVIFYEDNSKYGIKKTHSDLHQVLSVSIQGTEAKESYVEGKVPEWLINAYNKNENN